MAAIKSIKKIHFRKKRRFIKPKNNHPKKYYVSENMWLAIFSIMLLMNIVAYGPFYPEVFEETSELAGRLDISANDIPVNKNKDAFIEELYSFLSFLSFVKSDLRTLADIVIILIFFS